MNAIENIFLDAGFSWTLSKSIPYILTVFFGLFLTFIFRRKKKNLKNYLRWGINFVLILLPFGIYFIYSPIYEGDFSNNSTEVIKKDGHAELSGKKLVVITSPGCPYCYQALDRMLKLKDRVPEAELDYIVCLTKDSVATELYKEKAGAAVNVKLAENSGAMVKLAKGRFPTFILVNNNKPLRVWSNDSFGVAAMDEVELLLK